MEFIIGQKNPETKFRCYILDEDKPVEAVKELSEREAAYVKSIYDLDHTLVTVNQLDTFIIIYRLKVKKTDYQTRDACRKAGAEVAALCNRMKADEVTLHNMSAQSFAAVMMAEGISSSNYSFLKYRSNAAKMQASLSKVVFTKSSATEKEANQLNIVTEAVYKVRDLVNEPVNYLTAEQLSKEFEGMGDKAGFKVTVLNKSKIEKEKMGGLLAVNRGSKEPPTFTIMEYKPKKAQNKKPIVLIGKGIVYDTGGLSLKPTLNSMDRMKSDMSGAALVSGVMYAAAKLELPLHLIALVPATDNRPGEIAYTPGDVITMYSGKTVEVLNTDAEGRLVLADALHWAKRYDPELVADFATLTGAASAAVGEHGIVCMGNADDATKKRFRESGFRQYERLVEYPLWDEYGDQIKSDIADIKNVGGSTGGAITAGKFLEHFVDYPWMHFDIAGVSHILSGKSYLPGGATAYGMKMMLDFLTHYGKG